MILRQRAATAQHNLLRTEFVTLAACAHLYPARQAGSFGGPPPVRWQLWQRQA
jgi:hypothetical protein